MTPKTSGCALEALAVRCEQASGPIVVLERDIALAIYSGTQPVHGIETRISAWDGNGRTQLTVKAYTASLDAAMTLVPEGWGWNVSQPNEKAIASGLLKRDTPVFGEVQYGCDHRYAIAAATPALALCAAALRARARQATSAAIGGDPQPRDPSSYEKEPS